MIAHVTQASLGKAQNEILLCVCSCRAGGPLVALLCSVQTIAAEPTKEPHAPLCMLDNNNISMLAGSW